MELVGPTKSFLVSGEAAGAPSFIIVTHTSHPSTTRYSFSELRDCNKTLKISTAMAAQQDLQDLLRLLTVGRKIPMLTAMTHIKSLQAVNLRR